MHRISTTSLTLALTAGLLLMAGCATKPAPKPPAKGGHAHAHPDEGPHEGCLIEWGNELYHGEFTVDHDKKETVVYVLDDSATKAPNVKPEEITDMVVIIKNVTPPATIELKHDPKRTGAKGIAFVGNHEALSQVMEYKGELSGKVKGIPYSASFAEKAHDHKHEKK